MKKMIYASFILVFVLFGNQVEAAQDEACEFNDDREIIVKLTGEAAMERLDKELVRLPGNTLLEKRRIYTYQVPFELNYDAVLEGLQSDPGVLSADPNEKRCLSDTSSVSYFSDQWYLAYMNLTNAWKIEQGSAGVTVAVLDTGINADHPELRGRVLKGYNFVNDNALTNDDHGHGTFIAGIIAANMDDSGFSGLTRHVDILPVKVADSKGDLDISDVVTGVYYAIEQGADIINMSYTGETETDVEKEALEEAYGKGMTLVASSGNRGSDVLLYPASYQSVISVGASENVSGVAYDSELFRADFSNYGTMLDIAAPGVDILSIGLRDGYRKDDGTSFAAPMVSGLAALLKSKHADWEPAMIEWAIEKGAVNSRFSSGGWDRFLGYGVIDYYESLKLKALDTSDDIADDRSEAHTLEFEERFSEALQLPRDEDWYQITVAEDSIVSINLHSSSKNLQELAVLYEENGRTPINRVKDGNPSAVELEHGDYFLKVFETSGHWSESPYELYLTAESLGNGSVLEFKDLQADNSHYQGIRWIAGKGIQGYENGTFGVSKELTRPHAAIMFTRTLELDIPNAAEAGIYFKDVQAGDPYAEFIAAVGRAEIFKGSNGSFLPQKELTREQMATTLVNAFDLKSSGQHVPIHLGNVDESHKESVQILADLEITNQLKDYRPAEPVTRGQFATFLYNTAK